MVHWEVPNEIRGVVWRSHADAFVRGRYAVIACAHCRFEFVGKEHRAGSMVDRFVGHLEEKHMSAIMAGALACSHCERESDERTWTDGRCPECGAFTHLESRELRRRRRA